MNNDQLRQEREKAKSIKIKERRLQEKVAREHCYRYLKENNKTTKHIGYKRK